MLKNVKELVLIFPYPNPLRIPEKNSKKDIKTNQ